MALKVKRKLKITVIVYMQCNTSAFCFRYISLQKKSLYPLECFFAWILDLTEQNRSFPFHLLSEMQRSKHLACGSTTTRKQQPKQSVMRAKEEKKKHTPQSPPRRGDLENTPESNFPSCMLARGHLAALFLVGGRTSHRMETSRREEKQKKKKKEKSEE